MASKLLVRRSNTHPLIEIDNELENQSAKTTKKTENLKTFSANFNGNCGNNNQRLFVEELERISRKDCKLLLCEKDEEIEKLIEQLTILQNCNAQFAAENEKLHAKQCEQCEMHRIQADDQQKEQEILSNENKQLRDDIQMMKTLVYRLNVQIERYQNLLRETKPSCDGYNKSKRLYDNSISNWGAVNSHTLGPLLHGYIEIINEKSDLIDEYEHELAIFTGQLKQIVQENEKLQYEMDTMKLNTEAWITDKTRLEAQMDICRNKTEIQTKRADLAKEKLIEVVRCYEQKIQSLYLELERLQEAYGREKSELITLRNMQNSQPQAVVESLKECQKLFKELKGQYENEQTRLGDELKILKVTVKKSEQKIDDEKEKYKKLQEEYQKQHHANLMLNNKIIMLRQSLARLRLSRESIHNKLKIVSSVNNSIDRQTNRRHFKHLNISSSGIKVLSPQPGTNGIIHQETVHIRYLNEIEKLVRKLQQRDETLRKVLQSKS